MFSNQSKDHFNVAKNILIGGIAGSLTLAITYPLDFARIKLTNDLKSPNRGGEK